MEINNSSLNKQDKRKLCKISKIVVFTFEICQGIKVKVKYFFDLKSAFNLG